MEREQIIEYLKEIKRIAGNRYIQIPITGDRQKKNYYFWVELQIKSLLKYEHQYNDEELLQEAMAYEDIKPLDFND